MLQEPRGAYEYNGLNWRTVVLRDAPPNFAGSVTQRRTLYYDQRWRLLEERIDDDADAYPGDGDDRLAQMVWGERYIDDAVLRRESSDLGNDGSGTTWEDEWNYVTDAMFSVVAVIDASTAALVERTRYTPYGVARHSWPTDCDGDGDSDSADLAVINSAMNKYIHESGYVADADINRSGRVTLADSTLYEAISALAEGQVGESGSGTADAVIADTGLRHLGEANLSGTLGSFWIVDTALSTHGATPSLSGSAWDAEGAGQRQTALSHIHLTSCLVTFLLNVDACWQQPNPTQCIQDKVVEMHNCLGSGNGVSPQDQAAWVRAQPNIVPRTNSASNCNGYSFCGSHLGANFRQMCLCMGNSPWEEWVRGCIWEMTDERASLTYTHFKCWGEGVLATLPLAIQFGAGFYATSAANVAVCYPLAVGWQLAFSTPICGIGICPIGLENYPK